MKRVFDSDQILLKEDLRTYDPKDLWFSSFGLWIRKVYFKNKWIGLPFVIFITVIDHLFHGFFLYKKRNYPIVHAFRIIACLDKFEYTKEQKYLRSAEVSIEWLVKNYSKGYSGYCWGTGNRRVTKNAKYDANVPYTTNTPYILEAFLLFNSFKPTARIEEIIKSIYNFLEKDIQVIRESEDELLLSYAPVKENLEVYNSNAYCLYMYALFYKFNIGDTELNQLKIKKLFKLLKNGQNENGSWYYYTDKSYKGNFIDCFHSIFILKNLIKTAKIIPIDDIDTTIERGYSFLSCFKEKGMYKQFYVSDKKSLVKYDLYDNAEMYNLHLIREEFEEANLLRERILSNFASKDLTCLYSQIDVFGIKRKKNTLRWALMPYICAQELHEAHLNDKNSLHRILSYNSESSKL